MYETVVPVPTNAQLRVSLSLQPHEAEFDAGLEFHSS